MWVGVFARQMLESDGSLWKDWAHNDACLKFRVLGEREPGLPSPSLKRATLLVKSIRFLPREMARTVVYIRKQAGRAVLQNSFLLK